MKEKSTIVSTDLTIAQREIIDLVKSLAPLTSVNRDVGFLRLSQIHAEMTKKPVPLIVEDIPLGVQFPCLQSGGQHQSR